MDPKTIIELIGAIGNIATPILILALTGVGWTIKNRIERAREREDYWRGLEEKLRDDRIEVYNTILEPFIVILVKDEGIANLKEYRNKTKEQVASDIMLSLKYRQASFRLALFGSDNVVRAFNSLMQHFFKQGVGQTPEDGNKTTIRLLGSFLLEIRRSVGNETTDLKNYEMLEWLIKDIELFR